MEVIHWKIGVTKWMLQKPFTYKMLDIDTKFDVEALLVQY